MTENGRDTLLGIPKFTEWRYVVILFEAIKEHTRSIFGVNEPVGAIKVEDCGVEVKWIDRLVDLVGGIV